MNNIDSAFGQPIKQGKNLVIPATETITMMYSAGADTVQPDNQDKIISERDFSRPVAVVIASEEGIKIETVKDFSKIGWAALTVAIFLVGFFARLLNPSETLKTLSQGKWD
jgi:hypothetical protein